MKVITKIDGIDLLKMIANDELKCGTMIRHMSEDVILATNPPQPVYEYYKYTAGDKKFHRCDENGKLGAKGQQRFINYSTLNKVFEIVEIEEKEIKKLDTKRYKYSLTLGYNYNCMCENFEEIKDEFKRTQDKINELVKAVNSLKENK